MNEEIKEILKDDDELIVVYKDNSTRTFDTLTIDVIDYITKLQQENKILKENAEHNDKVVDKARWNEMIYKSRCKKANEFIDNNSHYYATVKHGEGFLIDLDEEVFCNTLLSILKGSD